METKPKLDLKALLAKTRIKKVLESEEETTEEVIPIAPIKVTLPSLISPRKDPSAKLSIQDRLRKLAGNSKLIPNRPIEAAPLTPIAEAVTAVTATSTATSMTGELITYNEEQQQFIDLVTAGKSCVLIGAAGSGKTTCSQGGVVGLLKSGLVPTLNAGDHKHIKSGTPGVLIISYTRRAVNNIRKIQSEDMKHNCITAHKLLEYAPEYFEVLNEETGVSKRTMQFLPTRDETNPLPSTIHTIIVEEASMLSVELYNIIVKALPHKVQWIFIGDIQQLPPVFGSAILGFKMLELPVIELTQIYRQALESPIIKLAHRILSGKPIPLEEFTSWKAENKLTIHPWKKKLSADNAIRILGAFFIAAIDSNAYDVEEDMILIPYNKACGTIELNKIVANKLARKYRRETFEVVAGFNKLYFSEGDKVLYDKEDAEILDISLNAIYQGTSFQSSSIHLDYWGHNSDSTVTAKGDYSDYDVDALLDDLASDKERVTQASHSITILLKDSGNTIIIRDAASINNLLHAYALTVHKAQGSEWRKVFFCLHQSHATMLQRELLYTGVTRAREELYIICEPESMSKGIISQRIKGNTLAEKAEYFKGKFNK